MRLPPRDVTLAQPVFFSMSDDNRNNDDDKNAKKGGATYVSLILFSSDVRVVCENVPAAKVAPPTTNLAALAPLSLLGHCNEVRSPLLRLKEGQQSGRL